jgi:hypothetical protein
MSKLKKAELTKAQELTNKYNQALISVGGIELQKKDFLIEVAKIRSEIDKLKLDLQEKYGDVNINLTTGEYNKNESNKKD